MKVIIMAIESTRYISSLEEAFKEIVGKEIPNEVAVDNKEYNNYIRKELGKEISKEVFKRAKDIVKFKDNKDKRYKYLIEPRPKLKSLGCGYHNGVYYFGTTLWKGEQGHSTIITSDKEMYVNERIKIKRDWVGENNIQTEFGLRYKNEFFDEFCEGIFTSEAIDKWLHGDCSKITLKNTAKKFIEINKKYIYCGEGDIGETKHILLACYRLSGFFMSVWNAQARLFITSDMGGAKTRQTNILNHTGFNSVLVGEWTKSGIQRLIESTRGEIHIDDFETLDDEKKKDTLRFIKVGYMKGAVALKSGDSSGDWKPEAYNLYNLTTLNNIEGLDFITHDRCIPFRIPIIKDKKYDEEPNFKDKIWGDLRDELYILGLKDAKRVSEEYPKIQSDRINGRDLFIMKPTLTIAKLISKDWYDKLLDWWEEELTQTNTQLDLSTDWEFQAYVKIRKWIKNKGDDENWFFLSEDICKPIIKELYTSKDFGLSEDIENKWKFKMATRIGHVLARNPRFKGRQFNGCKQYKTTFKQLEDYLKTKKYYDEIVNQSSTTPTTSTENYDVAQRSTPLISEDNRTLEEEFVEESPQQEIKKYIQKNPKDNAVWCDEKYPDVIENMKKNGDIQEIKQGTYQEL